MLLMMIDHDSDDFSQPVDSNALSITLSRRYSPVRLMIDLNAQ